MRLEIQLAEWVSCLAQHEIWEGVVLDQVLRTAWACVASVEVGGEAGTAEGVPTGCDKRVSQQRHAYGAAQIIHQRRFNKSGGNFSSVFVICFFLVIVQLPTVCRKFLHNTCSDCSSCTAIPLSNLTINFLILNIFSLSSYASPGKVGKARVCQLR